MSPQPSSHHLLRASLSLNWAKETLGAGMATHRPALKMTVRETQATVHGFTGINTGLTRISITEISVSTAYETKIKSALEKNEENVTASNRINAS